MKGGDGGASQMRNRRGSAPNKGAGGRGRHQRAVRRPSVRPCTDIGGATRDVATTDLDKQFSQTSKQKPWPGARSGLLGGSVDAEAGADLAQRYGEGESRPSKPASEPLPISSRWTRRPART